MMIPRLRKFSSFRHINVIHADPSGLLVQPQSVFNKIYKGVPLSTWTPPARGYALEKWARSMDENASDAKSTIKSNGTRRNKFHAEYDFLSKGIVRVEVKSSCLIWDRIHKYFVLNFSNVKQTNDEVRLVSYTPRGIFLHKWNGMFGHRTGIVSNLKGIQIQITASVDTYDWNEALDQIMDKDFGTFLQFTAWEDMDSETLFPEKPELQMFDNLPLSDMSPSIRGSFLTKWVRSFDTNTKDPEVTMCFGGRRKTGKNQTPYDYMRGDIRVEVKSSRMMFERRYRRWMFMFGGVKQRNFDELRLVFYTPGGVYVFIHDGNSGLSSMGEATNLTGEKYIRVIGPRNVADWKSAWNAMLKKNFGSLIIQCDF